MSDEAKAEEPTAEEPKADEPAAEEPKAEESVGSTVEDSPAAEAKPAEAKPAGSTPAADDEEAPLSPLLVVVLVALLGVVVYALMPRGEGPEGADTGGVTSASDDEVGELLQKGSRLATTRGPGAGLEKALPYFLQAVKLAPEDPRANAVLGRCLTELNRFSDAVPYLKKAIEKKPELHAAHLFLGMCYTGLERHKEAREALESAIRTDPHDPKPLYFLGIGAMRMGEDAKTVKYLEPYVRDVPRNPVAWRIYADALTKLGREDDAIAALTSLSLLTPGDLPVRQELQERRIRVEGFEAVLADQAKAAQAEGSGAETLYLHARLLSLSPDRADEARAAFEEFLKRFPQALRAEVDIAQADVRQGKLAEAKARLEKTISANPRMDDAKALIADIELQLKNYDAARAIYDGLLGGPLEAHARLGIASSYLDEGKGEEALTFVRGFLQGAEPGDPRRWALEGEVLQNLGRYDEARKILDELFEQGREQDRLIWQGYISLLELERGDPERMQAAFAKLSELSEKKELPPDAYLWIGVAAMERGDLEAAKEAWRKGATGPDHGEPALHTRACRRLLGEVDRGQLMAAARLAGYRYRADALFADALAEELAGDTLAAKAGYQAAMQAETPGEFPTRVAERGLKRLK